MNTSSVKLICPSGILDSQNANYLLQEINQSLTANYHTILIDFQNITFMDSSGLGALAISLKSTREAGIDLVLCSINEQVKMLLELTNMNQVFQIVENRAEFAQNISES
jgi:anti-anti-sigma factor